MLIRPGAVGDCILSFPALEFAKADFTEVWISSSVVPLVQFANRVKSIASTQIDLVLDDGIPHSLRKTLGEFDEIVSWYGANRPEFRAAINAIHPHCTFLQALPPEGWHEHACNFFLQQVGSPPGSIPTIRIGAVDPRTSLIIHPFSGGRQKNWPLDHFRELARQLPLPVEWTAGPAEELPGAHREGNLLDLARWMKGATAYLGNDSGISHLAAAIGLSTVALFGPTRAQVWRPLGEHVRILQHKPLTELRVETVICLVTSLWSSITKPNSC